MIKKKISLHDIIAFILLIQTDYSITLGSVWPLEKNYILLYNLC